ncbi:MAG: DUF4912 domain-containing protein [Bacteroidota bacterium]
MIREDLAKRAAAEPSRQPQDAVREGEIAPETATWMFAPQVKDWSGYELPHGYNRTRIVLLVRDPYWLHIYWEVGAAERGEVRNATGRDLSDLPNVLRLHDLTSGAHEDVAVPADGRNWYYEAGRPGHAFVVELGVRLPDDGFLPIVRSNQVVAPPDGPSPLMDEEWLLAEEKFQRLYVLAAGLGPGQSSVEIVESLGRRLARRMGSGAVGSFGSAFRMYAPKRGFWLVVGTELIVYGATEPDAEVTLDGQAVSLRPDGSFTARYALPDGERSLSVRAVSRDGDEQITIVPWVRKETRSTSCHKDI